MLHFRPMKAAGFNRDKNLWMLDSAKYWVEEKLNGDRVLMFAWSKGAQFFTRTLSKADGFPVEKTAWLPHLNNLRMSKPTLLDGEVVTPGKRSDHTTVAKLFGCDVEKSLARQQQAGSLVYIVFDCLLYEGEDVRDKPLLERQEYLAEALHYLLPQVHTPRTKGVFITAPKLRIAPTGQGMPFVKEIWARGGEGVIIKDTASVYTSDARPAGAWMKLKTEIEVDLVIMGYKDAKEESTKSDGTVSVTKYKGQVGSILLGAYERGALVDVCYSSGIDDQTRKQVSANGPKYLGQVVRVKAQSIMQNQQGKYSLQNPRIIGMRVDKRKEECTLSAMLKERGL